MWSPYQSNPLNHHPLKALLSHHLDLDALNSDAAPRVYVTATNVRTGLPRVFTQPHLTIDTLLASAALPTMFQAVEIDSEPYWDGGYSGNPSLFPLVQNHPDGDLLLVQTNPFERPDMPQTARDIANRLNEITFNTALLKELRAAMIYSGRHPSASATRLHRVICDDALAQYSPSSKLNVEWAYLRQLHAEGCARAEQFLTDHGDAIGTSATFDPASLFAEMDGLTNVDAPLSQEAAE